jgi:hypothetical protein
MFLEDTGIKLSSVVSDITGRSARAMLDALVAGERDPLVLANLALGSLQGKVPLLTRALTGNFSEHHAFMVASMLRAIDEANDRIARLSEEINRQLQPLRQQVDLLITIPGISLTLAQVLIAEIGVDMGRFATAGHHTTPCDLTTDTDRHRPKKRSSLNRPDHAANCASESPGTSPPGPGSARATRSRPASDCPVAPATATPGSRPRSSSPAQRRVAARGPIWGRSSAD